MNYEEYVEMFKKRSISEWEDELKRLRYRNPGLEICLDLRGKVPKMVVE